MPPLTQSLFDQGPPPPPPARFNLAEHALAGHDPAKLALIVAGSPGQPPRERWHYAELERAVLSTAHGLMRLGVVPGQRVMLRLGNVSDFPILFFAAAAIGAIPVPTSAMLTAAEARFIAENAEAAWVAMGPGLEFPLPAHASALDMAMLADMRRLPPLPGYADTRPDDPGYMVYTSGATGRPKGVVHAHRAVWARRMMWSGWYGLRPSDRMLHAGAFNWTYTLGAGLMDPWAIGATTIIYDGPRDPGVWPALCAQYQATLFAAVPSLYRQILKYGQGLETGFATLRHGLTAGEKLTDAVAQGWQSATGKPIYEALGMTEVSTYVSSAPDVPRRLGTAGRPQQGRVVAILPREGGETPLPINELGLLAVRRDDQGLMLGYWRRPDAMAEAFRGNWFISGDLARMDGDGYITYLGRNDDLMNALGYRVSPQEVEDCLLTHPQIVECAVTEVGLRADLSVIGAFIVARGAGVTAEALRAHCAAHLASYKIPKYWVLVDHLPRTPTGKVLRRQLGMGIGQVLEG